MGFTNSFRVRVEETAAWAGGQRPLSPQPSPPTLPGDTPRHSQATQSLQHVWGLPEGFYLDGYTQNTYLGRCSGGILKRDPNWLDWLLSNSRSTPSPSWTFNAFSLSQTENFCHLYVHCHCFGPASLVVTTGKEHGSTSKQSHALWHSSFLTTTDQYRVCLTAAITPVCLSISCSILLSLCFLVTEKPTLFLLKFRFIFQLDSPITKTSPERMTSVISL